MLIVFTAVLIGCNTMHGLGKDIEHLGQAMKQSANK
jgi:predicted small secreted protein